MIGWLSQIVSSREFAEFAGMATLVSLIAALASLVLGLKSLSDSRSIFMELTRFRGYFPSYGERIHHGKAPYIPAGVPA
ncbi:MAG TPA: hypothetical protein VME66_08740 [Candidatus Acidoferrales bacterium]|nr:hypothetical protein [Candidatus Acidoferrales bacterium]